MEIIIGRDAQTRQLNVVKDGVSKKFGSSGSVPMDVSRQHISLIPVGTGCWQIKNLNAQNVTFVNGVAVESKTISEGDKVELGNSHYLFQWDALHEPKVETVNIKELKKVWEDYEKDTLELDIAERKFNAARSATGIITMLAIACSIILGHSFIYILLYAIAIGISIIFTIQAYNKSTEVPQLRRDIKRKFENDYKCPKCHHFMGYQGFDILTQNDACPYCKTKFH